MNRTVTAFDIKAALGQRYRHLPCGGFWPEITVTAPDGDLRLDGVGIEWAHSNLWVHGYEIKVSRADWLRDAKFERYRPYCDTLTVVCPKGLIDRREMPGDIGLMWYDPESDTLRCRRRPGYDAPGVDTGPLKDRLLREVARGFIGPAAGRYGHYATAREYVEQKTAMQNIGLALGSKLAWRIQELEQRLEPDHMRRVNAKAEAYDRLADLLSHRGYTGLPDWREAETHPDTAFDPLDRQLADTMPRPAFDAMTRTILDTVGYARRRVGLDHGEEQ